MLEFYNLTFTCFHILQISIYAPTSYTPDLDINKLCHMVVNNAPSSKSAHTNNAYSFSTTLPPSVQENPHGYCDGGVKVGNPCGGDPNFICQRNAFRALCQCINGYVEDKSGLSKCVCPNNMVVKNGKCICNNGHKQAPDGKCIEPIKSCPWGERIQCYKGTGQLDSIDCIPICECIEGFKIDGKCDLNNILIFPYVYKGMHLQNAKNKCIVRGQNSSLELKPVNERCDFDKHFLCRKKDNEKPRCECTNGFELQMMGQSVSCACLPPKIKLGGKCECPNGQVNVVVFFKEIFQQAQNQQCIQGFNSFPTQQGVPGVNSYQTQQQRTTPPPYTQRAQNQQGVQEFNSFRTQQGVPRYNSFQTQQQRMYPNSYVNANDGNSGSGNVRYGDASFGNNGVVNGGGSSYSWRNWYGDASFGNNGFANSGGRTYSYSWGNCDPVKRKQAEQNAIRNADGSYSYTC